MEELQAFLSAGENSPDKDIGIESVRQMRELLSAMKLLYSKQQTELEKYQHLLAAGGSLPGGLGALTGAPGAAGIDPAMAGNDGVGNDEDPKRGIAVGHAPDGAAPQGGLVEPPAYQRDVGEGGGDGDDLLTKSASVVDTGPMGRQEAYAQFKLSEGLQINQRLLDAKRAKKIKLGERMEAARAVNKMKVNIDTLKNAYEMKKQERTMQATSKQEETEIIDEEEYTLIQQLKEAKGRYKGLHAQMQDFVREIESLGTAVDAAREELLTEFNAWYALSFHEPVEPLRQPSTREPAPPADKDVMDDDEQFEQLQMARVMADEPESLAFVRARKAVSRRGGPGKPRK